MSEKLPPFVMPYRHKESTFYMNSNRPIKAVAAQDWALRAIEGNEASTFFQAQVSAFWVIEGFLYKASLVEKEFPTLDYYLKSRDGLSLPDRWRLYNDVVSVDEASDVVMAFNATRRNAFETEIDTPPEEKKSALEQEP